MVCSKCGDEKAATAFRKRPSGTPRTECRDCESKARRVRDRATNAPRGKGGAKDPLDFRIDVVDDVLDSRIPNVEAGFDKSKSPSVDLEHLSDDEKTQKIAALIPEAARASQVEPCDCTWADFRAYCSIAWGESTYGIARRHITRVGGYNKIRDAFYPPKATVFALERKELHELATTNRQAARRETRDALFLRQVEEVARRSMHGKIPAEGWAKKFSDGYEGDRIVTCLWSDDHFDPESSLPGFDDLGQTRRVAVIASQHVSYKPQYRDRTEARMIINGDMIDGWLHGRRGAHPSVQANSAIWKYGQAAGYVAANFRRLRVQVVPGNHDRDLATDVHRAIDDKQYGYATTIAFGLKMMLANLKNTTVELAAPEVYFDHFGIQGMATHGDTLFGKVTPRKLDTSIVEYVINRFNAARGGLGPVKLVLLGHWHAGLARHLDNGVTVVVNGALTPSNEFARSIDAFEANCGHYLFESAPRHIWGDNRFVRVGLEDSTNAAHDGLIAPFVDFERAA